MDQDRNAEYARIDRELEAHEDPNPMALMLATIAIIGMGCCFVAALYLGYELYTTYPGN